MVQAAQRSLGWPVYPRADRSRPLLSEKIITNPQARVLCDNIKPLKGKQFYDPIPEIAGMLEKMPVLEAVRISVLAARLFSAEMIGETLNILCQDSVRDLIGEIGRKARLLSDQVLLGEITNSDVCDLAAAGALNNTMMRFIRDNNLLEVVCWLKINELGDQDLIMSLNNDRGSRERLVSERSRYRPPAETQQLRESLGKDFQRLSEMLEPININRLFWDPESSFDGRRFDKDLKQAIYRERSELIEVQGFLTHDIQHCLATSLANGRWLSSLCRDNGLLLYLSGLSKAAFHLRHLIHVLTMNKYRLDGVVPKQRTASLNDLIETAAIAAAHRWNIRVETTQNTRMGKVNLYFEDDLELSTAPSFLEITFYNLIKNSIKAEIEAGKKDAEVSIQVRGKKDRSYPNAVVVSVEDSASGFDLQRLIRAAQKAARDPHNKEIIENNPVFQRLLRWEDQPNLFRTFSMGEILDLAFIAKVSGFSDKSISSGLGLAEVAEISQLIGADVMLTNKFNGGALVSLVIGTEEERSGIISRELG